MVASGRELPWSGQVQPGGQVAIVAQVAEGRSRRDLWILLKSKGHRPQQTSTERI